MEPSAERRPPSARHRHTPQLVSPVQLGLLRADVGPAAWCPPGTRPSNTPISSRRCRAQSSASWMSSPTSCLSPVIPRSPSSRSHRRAPVLEARRPGPDRSGPVAGARPLRTAQFCAVCGQPDARRHGLRPHPTRSAHRHRRLPLSDHRVLVARPVRELSGVGAKTAAALAECGLHTVGDVVDVPRAGRRPWEQGRTAGRWGGAVVRLPTASTRDWQLKMIIDSVCVRKARPLPPEGSPGCPDA